MDYSPEKEAFLDEEARERRNYLTQDPTLIGTMTVAKDGVMVLRLPAGRPDSYKEFRRRGRK